MKKTKVCSKCGIEKIVELFYSRKGSKDGLRGSCKECDYKVNRDFGKKNKDKVKSYQKKYKDNNRDIINEKKRIYNKSHKEESRKWREQNKEREKEYARKYSKDLADSYIKKRLKYSDAPPELVELKRMQIKLVRTLKHLQNETK